MSKANARGNKISNHEGKRVGIPPNTLSLYIVPQLKKLTKDLLPTPVIYPSFFVREFFSLTN
jgi:hypothetical protein